MTQNTSSGGSSAIGSQQQKGNVQYGIMPEQLISKLQGQGNSGEFIVVQRTRQSDEPQVWSTGDPQQTQQLLQHVYRSNFDKQTTTA